jgi:hypothetical protein
MSIAIVVGLASDEIGAKDGTSNNVAVGSEDSSIDNVINNSFS